jgi:hypothetical protein
LKLIVARQRIDGAERRLLYDPHIVSMARSEIGVNFEILLREIHTKSGSTLYLGQDPIRAPKEKPT